MKKDRLPSRDVPGVLIFSCSDAITRGNIRRDFYHQVGKLRNLPYDVDLQRVLDGRATFLRKILAVSALYAIRENLPGHLLYVAQGTQEYLYLDTFEDVVEHFHR